MIPIQFQFQAPGLGLRIWVCGFGYADLETRIQKYEVRISVPWEILGKYVETRVTCLCDDQMMMRLVSYLLMLAAALACFGLVADAQQGGYTVESVRVQVFLHVNSHSWCGS